jgi:primosomal protein N''
MNDIIGFEAGVKELKRLLDEAKQNIRAARGQGADAMQTAVDIETDKLVEFTNRTEPKDQTEREAIRDLDRMADEAREEISRADSNEIISRIQNRASQLNQLTKSVKQQTADNERKAKEIRLIPVRSAIDAVTDTVEAFKTARNTLSNVDSDEAAVKSKVESVLRAITALEKAARDL